jgi:type I restriction enzyme, S subunit
MNNWQKYKIEDVCEFIGGSQPPKSTFINYPKKGYSRLVQTRDFKTDKFPTYIPTNSTTKFFNKEDIVIGRYGPPIFQIFRGTLEGAYNVALMKVVAKEKITTDFLYYFLIQKDVFEYVDKLSARTGGQTGVDLVSLNKYPINLPDKFEQQKIAKVLSDLDAKIELNNKINAELEAMAKLIYDYWFVQFEFPVLNPDGTQSGDVGYKSSGGKMVWNEELKREVPEGWEVGSLLDIATFTNGIACQKYRPEDGEDFYRVIKIREMGDGFTDKTEKVTQSIPEKVIVRNGDILFSWSATLDVKIWTGGTGGLNQHIFKVTSKKYPRTFFYFEVLRYLQYFKMVAELRKTTMGHITRDHLDQSRISIPPKDLIIDLHRKIDPIIQKLIKVKEENQKLSELRDWLLPMLMNGQVRVGEREEKLNMAAEPEVRYE